MLVQINYGMNAVLNSKEDLGKSLEAVNRPTFWKSQNVTVDELKDLIKQGYSYRPAVKEGGTDKKAITHCEFLCLDFDKSTFQATLSNEKYTPKALFLHTTPSFKPGENEKHRVIWHLSRPCTVKEIEHLYLVLLSAYPEADQAVKDAGRFFYGCNREGFCQDINLEAQLDVEELLKVSVKKPKTKTKTFKSKKKESEVVPDDEATEALSQVTKNRKAKKSPLQELQEQGQQENDFILDILDTLDGDLNRLFCLYDHNLTPVNVGGVDASQGWDEKWQGSNPFSDTDSSGTSFLVSYRDGFAPVWYDRSNNKSSGKYGNHGGTFFEYWHSQKFADQPFDKCQIISDIASHFEVDPPKQYALNAFKSAISKRLKGHLRFNEMTQQMEYWGEPVRLDGLKFRFESWTGVTILNNQLCVELAQEIAHENSYHPIREYLIDNYTNNSTKLGKSVWDTLANKIFGTITPLYNNYLKNWLVAAVARVCESRAVKYDHVMIIRGEQGHGKSTFFQTIASPAWFCDSVHVSNNMSKDETLKLIKFWIHELGEIEGVTKKADIEMLRQFITRDTETFRNPYSRDTNSIPRRFVLGGSANSKVIWNDPEGNRRAHVIDIGSGWVNNAWVKENRDLIWAYAYHVYVTNKNNLQEVLTLTQQQETIRQALNEEHIDHDSARQEVLGVAKSFFMRDGFVKFDDFAKHFYPDNPLKLLPQEKSRIRKILEKEGWELKQRRIPGTEGRIYAWFPKETLPETTPQPTQPTIPQPETQPTNPQTTVEAHQPAPQLDRPQVNIQPAIKIEQQPETLYKPDTVPSNGKVLVEKPDLFSQLLEWLSTCIG